MIILYVTCIKMQKYCILYLTNGHVYWRHETGLFVDVETILWVTAIVWVLVCDSIVFVCGIDAAAILYDLPQLFYYSFIGIL